MKKQSVTITNLDVSGLLGDVVKIEVARHDLLSSDVGGEGRLSREWGRVD